MFPKILPFDFYVLPETAMLIQISVEEGTFQCKFDWNIFK